MGQHKRLFSLGLKSMVLYPGFLIREIRMEKEIHHGKEIMSLILHFIIELNHKEGNLIFVRLVELWKGQFLNGVI